MPNNLGYIDVLMVTKVKRLFGSGVCLITFWFYTLLFNLVPSRPFSCNGCHWLGLHLGVCKIIFSWHLNVISSFGGIFVSEEKVSILPPLHLFVFLNGDLSTYLYVIYLRTGFSGKTYFFHISLQRLLRLHRCVTFKVPSAMVSAQSLLLAGNFCTANSSRVLAKDRWQTFENSLRKK